MKSINAFTIIETLVALVIIGIVLAMSLPALRYFYQRAADDAVRLTLLHALDFASQEARARHVPVVLCNSNNQTSCSGGWVDGMLIFMDTDEDGIVHDSDQIIQIVQGKQRDGKIYLRSFPYYRNFLVFPPTGLMRYDNATFWYCHTGGASLLSGPVWAVVMSRAGKIHAIYPDTNGNIKDSNGKALTCEDLTPSS